MIIKALAVAGGLAGAVGLSQFPEYSQQYTQRLAGAVQELSGVVVQFDADAATLGLNREMALDALAGGSQMGKARAISMGYVLERHQKLNNDLAALRTSSMTGKALNFWRFTDTEVARQAWEDFKPAVPVSAQGAGLGLAGFIAGFGLIGVLSQGVLRLTRRRRGPVEPSRA